MTVWSVAWCITESPDFPLSAVASPPLTLLDLRPTQHEITCLVYPNCNSRVTWSKHFSGVVSLFCPSCKDAQKETIVTNTEGQRLPALGFWRVRFFFHHSGKLLPPLRLCFVKREPVPNYSHSYMKIHVVSHGGSCLQSQL